MRSPVRRFIAALAVLATLWLAAGSAVASLVGCCPEQQPCCILAGAQSTCSGCVPSPVPIGLVVDARVTQGDWVEPAYAYPADHAAPEPSIWRPPDRQSVRPSNSFNQL